MVFMKFQCPTLSLNINYVSYNILPSEKFSKKKTLKNAFQKIKALF